MKIKINEDETYEIRLPEEASARELNIIIAKLNQIKKICGVDELSIDNNPSQISKSSSIKRRLYKSLKSLVNTREEALEYIKKYKNGERDFFKLMFEQLNNPINKIEMTQFTYDMRKKFNISNDEVNDYIIKSNAKR